jgi:hypothetical protein
MALVNSLLDTRIARQLFHKTHWKNNWDNFVNSLLPSVFLQRARLYKMFLENLQEPMGLNIFPKPETAYLVDPHDCRVVGSISAIDMIIKYF